MCACADAGTTGAVPKWHYSRTKSTRPRESGTFGYGPYKDEPWSMMSIDKRAYGVRDFYRYPTYRQTELQNDHHTSNP